MSNTPTQLDVERIARAITEVLRGQMAAASSVVPSVVPAVDMKPAVEVSVPLPGCAGAQPGSELVIAERVVTMAAIAGRLDHARAVVVSSDAVVTPAVRDEIQDRGLALVFRDRGTKKKQEERNGTALLLARIGATLAARPLVQSLEALGIAVDLVESDCLIETTARAAQAIHEGRLAAVLTRHVAAGLCLANRHAGVRALCAVDLEQMERDTKEIGANVLVLDPARFGEHITRRLVARFARAGGQVCPEWLRERLD